MHLIDPSELIPLYTPLEAWVSLEIGFPRFHIVAITTLLAHLEAFFDSVMASPSGHIWIVDSPGPLSVVGPS